MAGGFLARDRVERENLHTAVLRPRARHPADRGGGSPGQARVAVGLDLHLHGELTGHLAQQLVEEHRGLIRGGTVAIA